jgi:xylulokinase
VLESVAFEHAGSLARMRAHHPDVRPAVVRAYGGGSRSRLWNQMKADVLGLPYESLGDIAVTAFGVASLAAEGVGLINDAAAHALESVRPAARYQPDDDRRHAYVTAMDRYRLQMDVEVDGARRFADDGP